MTNDNPNPENLKFEPATDRDRPTPRRWRKCLKARSSTPNCLTRTPIWRTRTAAFPGMDGMDEGMFAQVQEMMAKMERADELEKENADLKGRLGRLAADFESYRRRTQEDVSAAEGSGKAKAAEAMMPIYDALDRAVTMGAEDPAKLIPGMQGVQANLLKVFVGLGLEATGKVGEHFDPQWHEALQVVPGDTDDTITQVYELGFKMGERLVRPARVVVSKKG